MGGMAAGRFVHRTEGSTSIRLTDVAFDDAGIAPCGRIGEHAHLLELAPVLPGILKLVHRSNTFLIKTRSLSIPARPPMPAGGSRSVSGSDSRQKEKEFLFISDANTSLRVKYLHFF